MNGKELARVLGSIYKDALREYGRVKIDNSVLYAKVDKAALRLELPNVSMTDMIIPYDALLYYLKMGGELEGIVPVLIQEWQRQIKQDKWAEYNFAFAKNTAIYTTISLPVTALVTALEAVLLFTSKRAFYKTNLEAVLFDFTGKSLNIVASDGNRLCLKRVPSITDKGCYLIPAKHIATVLTLLKADKKAVDGLVTLSFSKEYLQVESPYYTLQVPTTNEIFPDYTAVTPPVAADSLHVSARDLTDAVANLKPYITENDTCIIDNSLKGALTLSLAPTYTVAIEVKSVIQQGSRLLLQVGVDYKFLRDACKVLTKTCIISCSAPDAPIVIREGNTLILIMPRRIEH